MKNIVIILAIQLLFVSCAEKKDVRIAAIEGAIQKNALGVDIGYMSGELDTVVVVTRDASVKDLEHRLNVPVSSDFDKTINAYDALSNTWKNKGNIELYNAIQWEVAHLKKLKGMEPENIDYSVYKYTYTITNPFNAKERNTVSNYYFFDNRDSLLGDMQNSKMKKIFEGNKESDLQPYTTAMMCLYSGMEIH